MDGILELRYENGATQGRAFVLINQATQVQLRYKLLFPRRGSCVPVYLGQVDSLVHVEYAGGMTSVILKPSSSAVRTFRL